MAVKNKWTLGFLIVTLLVSGVVYLEFEGLKFRVDNDKSTFYVLEDSRWRVSGREYNNLFDGSSKMNRRASMISVETFVDPSLNVTTIVRRTPYLRGPIIVDTYVFQGTVDDEELFPVSHRVEVFNASGFFYRYEVRDLVYDGSSLKLTGSKMSFGRNMKVEWQIPFRWARVYKSGLLKVQYDILSDYEVFMVRLFDPLNNESFYEADFTLDNSSSSCNITDSETLNTGFVTVFKDFEDSVVTDWETLGTMTITNVSGLTGDQSMNIDTGTSANTGFAVFNLSNQSLIDGVVSAELMVQVITSVANTNFQFLLSQDQCSDCQSNSAGFALEDDGDIIQHGSSDVDTGINWDTGERIILKIDLDIVGGVFNVSINGTQQGTTNLAVDGTISQVTLLKLGDVGSGDSLDANIDNVTVIRDVDFCIFNSTIFNSAARYAGFIPSYECTDNCIVNVSIEGELFSNVASGVQQNLTDFPADNMTNFSYTVELSFGGGVFSDLNISFVNLSLPTVPTALACNSGGSCNGSFGGNVFLNCSGSTELDNRSFSYFVERGNETSSGVFSWVEVGNHSDDGFLVWDITSEPVGEIYEGMRCRSGRLGEFSDYFNISSNLTIAEGNLTLLFDGVNSSRKYELQYVKNVSVVDNLGFVWLDVDHPDYGVNFTNGTVPFTLLLNISNLSVQEFNGSASVEMNSTGGLATVILDNKTELATIAFNLSGEDISGYPDTVNITASGNDTAIISLIGELREDSLFVNNFSSDGVNLQSVTLLYPRSGSESIVLRVTKPVRGGVLTLNLTGTESNIGNDLEYFERFSNSDNVSVSNNLLNRSGAPRGLYDDFLNDSLTGGILWSEVTTVSDINNNCAGVFSASGGSYTVTSVGNKPSVGTSTCSSTVTSDAVDPFSLDDSFGLESNLSIIASCDGNGASTIQHDHRASLRLIDGDSNEVILKDYFTRFNCPQNGGSTTMQSVTVMRVEFDESASGGLSQARLLFDDVLQSTISLSTLDVGSLDFRLVVSVEGVTGGASQNVQTQGILSNSFRLLGISQGMLGIGNVSNLTSINIHNTGNTTTSATLSWRELVRDGEQVWSNVSDLSNSSLLFVNAYLSADNGATYESVLSGTTHVFTSSGNNLSYRFNLSDNNDGLDLFVGRIKLLVVPERLDNLTIDVGADGIIEKNFTVFNVTNDSIVISDGSVEAACGGVSRQEECNVTISFSTTGAGSLIIGTFNYSHNPNPIFIDVNDTLITLLQDFLNPVLEFNFTNGNLTVDGLDLRYWGSGNVTVVGHDGDGDLNGSHELEFRYSLFNITSPLAFFDMTPNSVNSSNVEPWGQNAKFNISIFNTSVSSNNDDNMNMTFWLNKTIDSCVTLFVSNQSSLLTGPTFNLNNSAGEVDMSSYENMAPGAVENIFIWGNFTSCNASNSRFFDPFNYWNSYCIDCVRNDLNNNTDTT